VQSSAKHPVSKLERIFDPKIGVATCITKKECNDLFDSDYETSVKQPIASTPALPHTSPVKHSADVHDAKKLISLHEDDWAREAQACAGQDEIRQYASDSRCDATCSDNCQSNQTEGSSVSSSFSQHGMHLLFILSVHDSNNT